MSDALNAAWTRLATAATAFDDSDKAKRGELHAAALAYAAARAPAPVRTASGERSAVSGDGWTFRFGRNSGKTPDAVSVDDLRWYERVFRESLDNPEKERFRENNQRSLDVVRAELRRRGEAGDW